MIYLNNRTQYSFRFASGKLEQVLETNQGISAGIADRAGTWGHVPWMKACEKRGIKPIFGVELAVTEDCEKREKGIIGHVTLIARNNAGLREIYQLTTLATEKFYYVPRLDPSVLENISENVWLLYPFANWPEEIALRNNCYYLLEPGSPDSWKETCRGAMDRVIPSANNIYPTPALSSAHEMILGKDSDIGERSQHILSFEEWLIDFPDFSECLANSERLAEEADAILPTAKMVKPKVDKTLLEQCEEAAERKGVDLSDPIYKERLERELRLIAEKNFEDYFYVVADMVQYAKKHMLVGPARGSSCGSLVCYLTDITDIDPIPYDLLFERFIDINRSDYPDIDIDFAEDKREMVFEYLREKYGYECVTRLGTVNVFKPKSAITAVSKALRIPMWKLQDFKDAIIERSGGDSRASFCILDSFNELDVGRRTLEEFPELVVSGEIEGHASHTGMHAAAILVTAEPIHNYCSVNEQTGAAMIDKYDAESVDLLKIDALGLRTLSVIQDCLDQTGVSREELRNWDKDDQKAYQLLRDNHYAGIFQFEGYALQSLTKQLHHMDLFEDIVNLTALGRPGPFNSGGAAEWVRRRNGVNEVAYMHPATKPMTEVTMGVVIYQEQVMQIVREVGRMDWADVNMLRKGMSKSMGKEFFDRYYANFEKGCLTNGVNKEEAKHIWDQINTMGSWAFNRSHAVAYGTISYWCLVLKAHYPLEFAAACLRNAKDEDQSIKILRELNEEGYKYKPYDSEKSLPNWSVQNGILIGGLTGIKGIGDKVAADIIARRKEGRELTRKQSNLLKEGTTPWDSVFEGRDLWGHVYEHPTRYGIQSKLYKIRDIPDREGTFVFLAKIREKTQRDLNELIHVERRGGKKMSGQTLYLNFVIEDDTDSMHCTVGRFNYIKYGKPLIEAGKVGDWYVFKATRKGTFPRLQVDRWKKMTGNEDFKKMSDI